MDVIGKKLEELKSLEVLYKEELEKKLSEIEHFYKGQEEAFKSITVDEEEAQKIEQRIQDLEVLKQGRINEQIHEHEIEIRCILAQMSLLLELSSKGYKITK